MSESGYFQILELPMRYNTFAQTPYYTAHLNFYLYYKQWDGMYHVMNETTLIIKWYENVLFI